jgi:hypothetical protein
VDPNADDVPVSETVVGEWEDSLDLTLLAWYL